MLGQAGGVIKKYAAVTSESYTGEGCVMEVSIVPGGKQASHPVDNPLTNN